MITWLTRLVTGNGYVLMSDMQQITKSALKYMIKCENLIEVHEK